MYNAPFFICLARAPSVRQSVATRPPSLGHFVLGIRPTTTSATESVSKSTGMQQLYRLYLSASLVYCRGRQSLFTWDPSIRDP